jgi:hypothetical protein
MCCMRSSSNYIRWIQYHNYISLHPSYAEGAVKFSSSRLSYCYLCGIIILYEKVNIFKMFEKCRKHAFQDNSYTKYVCMLLRFHKILGAHILNYMNFLNTNMYDNKPKYCTVQSPPGCLVDRVVTANLANWMLGWWWCGRVRRRPVVYNGRCRGSWIPNGCIRIASICGYICWGRCVVGLPTVYWT